jgi:hypothetical protein
MPAGRPTAYKPENAEIARRACLLGATNEDLAERFEVSRTTIDNWIASIPDFSAAVKQGRQVADEAVVAALLARAIGMEHKSTKVFCQNGQPVTAEYMQYFPPDMRACMFWLRNRSPAHWRENRPVARGSDVYESDSGLEAWKRERLAEIVEQARAKADPTEPDAALAEAAERLRLHG